MQDVTSIRRTKDNREALYLWGTQIYKQCVESGAWGQIIITIQEGKTTTIEKRITEKPIFEKNEKKV